MIERVEVSDRELAEASGDLLGLESVGIALGEEVLGSRPLAAPLTWDVSSKRNVVLGSVEFRRPGFAWKHSSDNLLESTGTVSFLQPSSA